jgi:hypothetical protein
VLLSTPLHASSNFTVSVQLANKRGLKKRFRIDFIQLVSEQLLGILLAFTCVAVGVRSWGVLKIAQPSIDFSRKLWSLAAGISFRNNDKVITFEGAKQVPPTCEFRGSKGNASL